MMNQRNHPDDDYSITDLIKMFGLGSSNNPSQSSVKDGTMQSSSLIEATTEPNIQNHTYTEARQHVFGKQQNIEQYDSHFLITHPRVVEGLHGKHEARDDDENVHPPGILNPVDVHTIRRAINIDSRFRDNYYHTNSANFIVTLPMRITDVVKMQIGNLAMPLSFYTFSRKLNNVSFIVITNYGTGTQKEYVVTLPDGNYSSPFRLNIGAVNIEEAVNEALEAAGINTGSELVYRVDKRTGRSVFAVPEGGSLTNFRIQFACDADGNLLQDENIQLRFGWPLGFRVGTYIGGPPTSGTGNAAVVSEGVCMTTGPRYMLLAIDEFASNAVNDYFISAFQSSLNVNNVISRIDIGTLRDSYGFFQMGDAETFTTQVNTARTYFGPVTIEKLKLTLYDEYGRVVDLNNMDWSITLAFTCVYNK